MKCGRTLGRFVGKVHLAQERGSGGRRLLCAGRDSDPLGVLALQLPLGPVEETIPKRTLRVAEGDDGGTLA